MDEFLPPWNNHLDPEVHRAVMEFHARSNWVRTAEVVTGAPRGLGPERIQAAQFSQPAPTPSYSHAVELTDSAEIVVSDDYGSHQNFDASKCLSGGILSTLLIHSFGSYQSGIRVGHRPYPSAGGLYTVEPFVVVHRSNEHDLKAGVYQFLPNDHILGCWPIISNSCPLAMLGYLDNSHSPSVSVIYVLNVHKALFKYQFRGYRHALMEVGSMYQQAKRIADKMGVRSHCWSSFSDDQINQWLGLNPLHYFPVLVQSFGYPEELEYDL